MRKKLLVAATVAVLSLSSVSVMAANSPEAPKYNNITIGSSTVGSTSSSTITVPGGSITTSTGAVEEGKEVTFTATAEAGKVFVKWVITGDYTVVSGSLTTTTITVIPKGDLVVNAEFATIEVPTTQEAPTVAPEDPTEAPDEEPESEEPEEGEGNEGENKDPSATSPQTGIPAAGVLVTLLASGAVAITAKKKF